MTKKEARLLLAKAKRETPRPWTSHTNPAKTFEGWLAKAAVPHTHNNAQKIIVWCEDGAVALSPVKRGIKER